jgi:hypothetical protein
MQTTPHPYALLFGKPGDPRLGKLTGTLTPMSSGRCSRRHVTAETHFEARERYQASRGLAARREKAQIRREVAYESSTRQNLLHSMDCRERYLTRRELDTNWQRLVVRAEV